MPNMQILPHQRLIFNILMRFFCLFLLSSVFPLPVVDLGKIHQIASWKLMRKNRIENFYARFLFLPAKLKFLSY